MFSTMGWRGACAAAVAACAMACGDAGTAGDSSAASAARQAVASTPGRAYVLREVNLPATPPAPADSRGDYTSIFGINNRGVMVGNYAAANDPSFSFIGGFLYDHGVWTRVAIGDAVQVSVIAINDHGVSVGEVSEPAANGWYIFRAFRRDASGRIDLLPTPTTWAPQSVATDINNAGTIVGSFFDASAGDWLRGYVYQDGQVTTFNVPGALGTKLNGIDDLGRLVGTFITSPDSDEAGFISDRGRVTTFAVAGAVILRVRDINNRGQVVGSYWDATYAQHGFLYEDGRITTIDFPGSSDTSLWRISDQGTLVGTFDYYSWGLVGTLESIGAALGRAASTGARLDVGRGRRSHHEPARRTAYR